MVAVPLITEMGVLWGNDHCEGVVERQDSKHKEDGSHEQALRFGAVSLDGPQVHPEISQEMRCFTKGSECQPISYQRLLR